MTSSPLPTPSELLRAYGLPAKKALGQNFLTDPNILDRIVAVAGVQPGDEVLEIGPGPGGLTSRLLHAGASVHAVELDRDASAFLREVFADQPGFRLTEGDAMKLSAHALTPSSSVRVVANLPYHVATHVLLRLVRAETPPGVMALMFQREVAEKLTAEVPSRGVGPITILVAVRYRTRISLRLPPGAFHPPPKVESAVVRFELREQPLVPPEVESVLRRAVDLAFQQRRKTLRNALSRWEGANEAMETVAIEPSLRPEALRLDQWFALATALASPG